MDAADRLSQRFEAKGEWWPCRSSDTSSAVRAPLDSRNWPVQRVQVDKTLITLLLQPRNLYSKTMTSLSSSLDWWAWWLCVILCKHGRLGTLHLLLEAYSVWHNFTYCAQCEKTPEGLGDSVNVIMNEKQREREKEKEVHKVISLWPIKVKCWVKAPRGANLSRL